MKKRWDVLIDLLKNEKHNKGVEIGVLKAVTSIQLIKKLPNLEILFMIDPWRGDEEFLNTLDNKRNIKYFNFEELYNEVKNKVKDFKQAKIMRMNSKKASENFKDGELDFVFIDGNHSYEFVKEDIKLWKPKIKRGGWLTGHDYADDIWDKRGVKRAVDELIDDFKVEDTVWYTKIL